MFEDYPNTRPSIATPTGAMPAGWPRWLEVLPIPVEQKQWLVAAEDNQPALSLLSGLLVASH